MNKIKELYKKHGEIIRYIVFGVATTVVALVTYYLTFVVSEHLLQIPLDDKKSGAYIAVYSIAQVLQWVLAVLFAFYTNKKWVFTDADREASTLKQLLVFSGGRLLTFLLDVVLAYLGILAFDAIMRGEDLSLSLWLLNVTLDAEFFTKIIVSIVVLVSNYLVSKLLVFKSKKS